MNVYDGVSTWFSQFKTVAYFQMTDAKTVLDTSMGWGDRLKIGNTLYLVIQILIRSNDMMIV